MMSSVVVFMFMLVVIFFMKLMASSDSKMPGCILLYIAIFAVFIHNVLCF